MFEARKLPLERGLAWFLQAVNVGRRNPRTVLGAAALLILTLYVITFLLLLPVAWQGVGSDGLPMLGVSSLIAIFATLMCILPVLLGGLIHVVRESEEGREVGIRDLFVPFRNGSFLKLFTLGLVQLGLNALAAAAVALLAGPDYWSQYFAVLQQAMSGTISVAPQPQHPYLMFIVQTLFNYVSAAILMFSIPSLMFLRVSVSEAVKMSLSAAIRNVVPNLGAAALFLLGVVVATVVASVIGLIAATLGSLVHPAIGVAILALVYLCFGSTILLVLAGCALAAWRDTFGINGEANEPPAPPGSFAA